MIDEKEIEEAFEKYFEEEAELCHQEDEPGIEANLLQNKHHLNSFFEAGAKWASEKMKEDKYTGSVEHFNDIANGRD